MTFKNTNVRFYKYSFRLGDRVSVSVGRHVYPNCKFIKVTMKGFNVLNMDTNRVVFTKHHLYGVKMAGKEYPSSGPISVTVIVSELYQLRPTQ